MVVSLGPLLANGTLWTDDLAPLPIQGETGNIESILGKCLPTMIWRHGSDDCDLMLYLTVYQQPCVRIPRIHEMLSRQKALRGEVLMNDHWGIKSGVVAVVVKTCVIKWG